MAVSDSEFKYVSRAVWMSSALNFAPKKKIATLESYIYN